MIFFFHFSFFLHFKILYLRIHHPRIHLNRLLVHVCVRVCAYTHICLPLYLSKYDLSHIPRILHTQSFILGYTNAGKVWCGVDILEGTQICLYVRRYRQTIILYVGCRITNVISFTYFYPRLPHFADQLKLVIVASVCGWMDVLTFALRFSPHLSLVPSDRLKSNWIKI